MAKIGTIPGYVTAVQNYAAQKGVPFATVPKAKPYNPYAYVPGGASPAVAKAIQAQGYATPYVGIPNANSIVQPNANAGAGAAAAGDPYGNELTADRMYGIGQKNYADALSMGERSMLSEPINRLIQAYGYDPRTTALGDVASRYFDPVGLEAARKGGYTTSQQIERGFGQALAGVPTDLGMNGLQHSGSSASSSRGSARRIRTGRTSRRGRRTLGGRRRRTSRRGSRGSRATTAPRILRRSTSRAGRARSINRPRTCKGSWTLGRARGSGTPGRTR
jgi:hypothetical protein